MLKILRKIAKWFIIGILLVFFGYQIYAVFGSKIITETAYKYSITDTVTGTGLAFKSETILETDKNSIISYNYNSGEKISKGEVIGNIYSSEQDIVNLNIINYLQEKIDILEEISSQSSVSITSIDTVLSQISYNAILYNSNYNSNIVIDSTDYLDDIFINLMKRASYLSVDLNLDDQISELQAEIDSISATVSGSSESITSTASGYFITDIDSLETLCDVDNLYNYTEEEILELIAQAKSAEESSYIGKLVTNFKWYYVAIISDSDAKNLKEGMNIEISFEYTDINDISAEIIKIKDSSTSDNSLVYIESSIMSGDIADLRTESITINVDEYSGIRVSSDAVRIIDGVKGVYVITGSLVEFKQLDTIYENDYYVISAESSDSSYLQLYDEVIVSGGDLYDGKIV